MATKATAKKFAAKVQPTFDVGARVKWVRRNGEEAKGRIVGAARVGLKGPFYPVDSGPKDAPDITWVRPTQLRKF